MTSEAPLPVHVLTGFLGSGKTTLLGVLLRHQEFSRTAVIINEFGAVGLDHDLVEASDESFIELKTGCLCCAVRGDLVRTLGELLQRRDAGTVPPFERVVIETSGLADPAPVLHALMGDDAVACRMQLAGVVTTIDAVNGMTTLDRQPESVKQAAVADRLIVTKSDLADAPLNIKALTSRLTALNPTAPQITASFGAVEPERLFGGPNPDPGVRIAEMTQRLADAGPQPRDASRHNDRITVHTIVREAPIAALALTLFLEALAEQIGSDLLRLKGLVAIAENPDKPAVIHGVQHVFHPPAWLARWPSDDHRTRLVFIARDVPGVWIDALLAAIEAEVEELRLLQKTA